MHDACASTTTYIIYYCIEHALLHIQSDIDHSCKKNFKLQTNLIMSSSSRSSSFKRSYSSNLDIASRQSTALVFEFGTAFLRVGIAGEPRPRHIFPLKQCQPPPLEQQLQLQLQKKSDIESNSNDQDQYPHQDWTTTKSHFPSDIFITSSKPNYHDHLGPWISNLYTNHLLLKPRSRKVLIILPIYQPPALQHALTEIFLKDLQVPSLLIVNPFRTIPYAIGNYGAGIIVDIGQVEGRVVCFFNGLMIEHTLEIVPVGYASLLNALQHVNMDQDQQDKDQQDQEQISVIRELYFNLENTDSLLYAFMTSLLRCPVDLRKQVVQHVVFVGGGVEAITKFEHRFLVEVQSLFECKGAVECNVHGRGSGSVGAATRPNDDGNNSGKRNIYRVKEGRYKKFNALASVIMNAPLGVLYPLQYRPSLMAWMGASIMGSIKLSKDEWIHRSN